VEYLESALKLGQVAGDKQWKEAKRRRKDSDLALLFKEEPSTPEQPQTPELESVTPEEPRTPEYDVFDDGGRRPASSVQSAGHEDASSPLARQ